VHAPRTPNARIVAIDATPEQAMLNLKTTYAIERAVATGQAVRLE
jgi:hypothetical protein